MTDFALTAVQPLKVRPLRALQAVRRLLADKEDTAQVFEIMRALNGRSTTRGYHRLIATVEGGRIAYARPELAELLSDRDALRRLPAGSVGRAYAAFMDEEDLTAEGLVEESLKGIGQRFAAAHPYAWYGRRLRDVHDLWHVLLGYGRDALGEGCVVAFSYAQTGGLGFGVIALAAGAELGRRQPGHPFGRALREAWGRGRRAAWLPAVDYEALMAEPLERARARLGLGEPRAYLAVPPAARDGLRPSRPSLAAAA